MVLVAFALGLAINASHATDNSISFKQQAELKSTQLPASGQQSTLLDVSQFGRYAITAQSAQGTALQYVDRMAGPSGITGIPGKQDGRLDLFLNQGEYKIITHADKNGTGEVSLQAHAFPELNSADIPQLIKYKIVSSALDDFQQRSYWLYLKTAQVIAIEAAGRNLADLRLWKDGNWLVDSEPAISQVYPDPHRPLQVCQLNLRLEPGLYLLTAYGGPSQPWTEESKQHPLHIRYGIPSLDVAGQRRYSLSVFGTDRFRVPGEANYFQLSLPEAKAMQMSVGSYVAERAFNGGGNTVAISKKSLPPVAELELSQAHGERLITLTGQAGQPYILRQFTRLYRYTFRHGGEYWLSTIHSGSAGDSVDATSVLTQRRPFHREEYLDSRVVRIDPDQVWQRRFNLLENLTQIIDVPASGKYMLHGSGEGVRAKYRIEPFLTRRPRDYESPPFEDDKHQWDLDAGLYVLTVQPERKGILTLRIATADNIDSDELMNDTVEGASRYGKIDLDRTNIYTLYLNQQPGVNSGVILRELPLDLRQALPVTQRAREVVQIPVTLSERGRVRAVMLDGKTLPVSTDQTTWQEVLDLASGRHAVAIRNETGKTQSYSLVFTPQRLATATPLPAVPASALAGIPHFPILTEKKPIYLDLDRQQQTTFAVKVKQPALYWLETTGLLETLGNLRTRTNPSLVRRQDNGIGRNFQIQTYLRQGDYQLSIQTRGRTRGHLGMVLQQTPLLAGGVLTQGIVARAMLKSGHGLAYTLHIDKAGNYRIRAMGVARRLNMRLEDKDGWPVLKPDIRADVVAHLQPGEYRLILLPQAIDARAVTLFKYLPAPVEQQGHGPFPLALNHTVKHEWREPDKGDTRIPDVWTFEIPAPLNTTIRVDHDMQGSLQRVSASSTTEIASIASNETWTGTLQAGTYHLSLTNRRRNNHVAYQLSLTTKELSVGQVRKLRVPATIPVSIGADNIYEFSSYGDADVRARLLDAQGRVIVRNDDYINDWNFVIARRLGAGHYQLQIEPLNKTSATTTVQLHSPQAISEKTLVLPAKVRIDDNDAHVYPLNLAKPDKLLVVQADSSDTIGLSIEAKRRQSWQVVATSVGKHARLLMPVKPDRAFAHRIRVWSLDRRNAAIRLRVNTYRPGFKLARNLLRMEIPLRILPGPSPQLAIAAVKTDRPGLYRINKVEGVLWTSQAETALKPTQNGLLASSSDNIWFAQVLPKKHTAHPRLRVSRLRLGDDNLSTRQLTLLPAQRGFVDIKSHAGPVLMLADSRVGRAGLQLIKPEQYQSPVDSRRLAVAGHTTVSALADGRAAMAMLWDAGTKSGALDINVKLYRFTSPKTLRLDDHAVAGVLTPGRSVQVNLAAANHQVQLVLPARTAAILQKGGQRLSTHWTGDAAQRIELATRADSLWLLYAGKDKQQFRVSATSGAATAITSGAMYRASYTARGQEWLRIQLAAGSQAGVLRIRGQASGVYIEDSGRILSGKNLALSRSGSLQLQHGSGRVLAWIDKQTEAVIPASAKRQTIAVAKPAPVKLTGVTQYLSLKTTVARLVHLHSSTAMVTRVQVSGQQQQVEAHPYGVDYAFFMPAGETDLALTALATTTLRGQLDVTATAATAFSEGPGPEVILPGGGSKLYKFKLAQSGPVGIGVRSSSDVVDAVLLNSHGKVLGRGVVQMPNLSAGWYWLLLTAPAAADPVHVRPVLVGTKPPATGPPAKVIREYLKRAGRKLNETRGKP
jgi:hypothetical protein